MYKSLIEGLTLPLDWPIIALVGPNGTNKSSVLQAISAAPEGRSLAPFWFSTAVDDIDRGVRGRATHRFIYKYKFDRSGISAECRKYRGSKKYRSADVPSSLRDKRDPDYWEPTKRVAGDGMSDLPADGFDDRMSESRDRWNPIQKPVLYLDFRSELSAFDKFIHHQSFDRWTPDNAHKRYRAVLRSKWIARALSGKPLPLGQAKRLLSPLRYIGVDEVAEISKILGKPITKIAIIEHRFFGPSGFTIRIHLDGTDSTYSEAHAGSGEYAVVRLVDAIRSAKAKSLILLDEPEVSLHPGAQTALMAFIEREVLKHGHQVIFSTHSPTLAASLPSKAIKVFGFDPAQHQVVLIANGCSSTEAFAHLGHTTAGPPRPRLIVEDDLAAEIVRASLRRHAPTKLNTLEIVPFPGGANGIIANVLPALAVTRVEKTSILLDGDQLPSEVDDSHDLKISIETSLQMKNERSLQQFWKKNFHETIPNLHSNSDGSGRIEAYHCYIDWSKDHLGYLPGESPEAALAKAVFPDVGDNIGNGEHWKDFWRTKVRDELRLTTQEPVTSEQIFNMQRTELAHLADDCHLLRNTFETIERIIEW